MIVLTDEREIPESRDLQGEILTHNSRQAASGECRESTGDLG